MSLAEGPPDLPYPKLPFWDTIGLSYSTYFQHFLDAVRASWLWLIVAAAATSVASWMQWSWMATAMSQLKPGVLPKISSPMEATVLWNLDNAILLLASVSIAVAWHRLMILDERPGFSGGNIATKTLWRYVGIAVAIFLINFLPAAAVMVPMSYFLSPVKAGVQPPPALFALVPLIFVLFAVGAAAAIRLSLLLPARAIGNRELTIKQTWRRTHGNTWRLLWGVALTTFPPMIIFQIGFVMLIGFPNPTSFASGYLVRDMSVTSTIFSVYHLLIVPIGIGFLSHAYRHFFQAPLELP